MKFNAFNNGASKYMKQNHVRLQKELDKYKVIIEDFNTPLSINDRHKQKIRKILENLN